MSASRCTRRPLIERLDARVEPGEVLVVMGESGSGKRRLLAHGWSACCGRRFIARGRRALNGREIGELPTTQRRIGMLFQDDLLFPHIAVLDNLLFALPARAARRAHRARAEAALRSAGLAGFGARPPAACRAGSARASRCCAPCSPARARCCSTSRSRASTPRCASAFAPGSSAQSPARASPRARHPRRRRTCRQAAQVIELPPDGSAADA